MKLTCTMFSEDEQSEESNVESDAYNCRICEWRCAGNRTGLAYSMTMMMLLRQPVSPRAVGARCGKISLFYEWKSCQFVCLRLSEETESIPTVTLNHRGRSKKRRNATVQRRRINRLGYVSLIRLKTFELVRRSYLSFVCRYLYSKSNLILILFLVWFQLRSVKMRHLRAEISKKKLS